MHSVCTVNCWRNLFLCIYGLIIIIIFYGNIHQSPTVVVRQLNCWPATVWSMRALCRQTMHFLWNLLCSSHQPTGAGRQLSYRRISAFWALGSSLSFVCWAKVSREYQITLIIMLCNRLGEMSWGLNTGNVSNGVVVLLAKTKGRINSL